MIYNNNIVSNNYYARVQQMNGRQRIIAVAMNFPPKAAINGAAVGCLISCARISELTTCMCVCMYSCMCVVAIAVANAAFQLDFKFISTFNSLQFFEEMLHTQSLLFIWSLVVSFCFLFFIFFLQLLHKSLALF